MKRKHKVRRVHHKTNEQYLVVVRSWMLVVAFALMLGIGAMVGKFISGELNASNPSVAGVQSESR